jgi:CubicO group peptidase (beta-lactamase class C family)
MIIAIIVALVTLTINCLSSKKDGGGYMPSNTLMDNQIHNAGIYVKNSAVLLGNIHNTSPISEEYFGDWNKNTIVAIGSCGKSAVCTAVVELHKLGKLSIYDKINKYFKVLPDYDKVNLADIMTHRSGIEEFVFGSDKHISLTNDLSNDPILCRKEFTQRRLLLTPDFIPLSKNKYSNDNFCIIAAVIEQVTLKNYRDVLHELVASPIGVRFIWGYQQDVSGYIVSGWGVEPKKIFATPEFWKITPYSEPSGDVFMSIGDFYKYVRAHANTFVHNSPFSNLLYSSIGDKALGWVMKGNSGSHTGGAFGHSSKMIINDAGYFIIGIQNTLFHTDFGLFNYMDEILNNTSSNPK